MKDLYNIKLKFFILKWKEINSKLFRLKDKENMILNKILIKNKQNMNVLICIVLSEKLIAGIIFGFLIIIK